MPKEIVVNAWCDPCYQEGESSPAEEVTVALGDLARLKPQVMLLCERHRKEVYEPLRELLEKYGATSAAEVKPAKAGKPRRAPSRVEYGPFPEGEWECPDPDCGSTDLHDKAAVQKHMRLVHDVTLGDFLKGSGSEAAKQEPRATTEMPLRHIPEQGVPMFCPIEGCSQSPGDDRKPAKNKRSLATHMSARHGIPIGEWFRQHPDVDPESLVIREGAA